MDGQAKDIKPKKRFFSFFGRLSGSKNLNSKHGGDLGTEDTASTMILKLKSPGAAGDEAEESNGQLLSEILTNEQLFDMLYGKSLVLQAEMSVEKRKDDGSPKTMTISGLVPVTLSRGERNGKPTRELQVRGHLRQKRSKDLRLPYDDLALKSSGFGSDGRKREIPYDWRPKPPEESKLLQARNSIYERYRTISTVSAKSKRESIWPQTDVECVDSGDDDPEPSRIENWSPLFDFSSPMSGPTGRDRVRALSDWTTPTPRFDLDLMKDEGAEERSKEKVQDVERDKRLRYNHPSQSDKDECDRCSAKPCSKDKHSETRDTGSQTYEQYKSKEVARVHSNTQTDAAMQKESSPDVVFITTKKTNLLSPEEIQQKFSRGFNESKQLISSVQEKATSKFAEVHGRIQNAIHKRAGERQAEYQDSLSHSNRCDQRHEHGNVQQEKNRHLHELRPGEMKDFVCGNGRSHWNGQNHDTDQLNGKQVDHPKGQSQPNHEEHEQSNSKSNVVARSSHSKNQERKGSKHDAGGNAQTQRGHHHEKNKDIQNLHYRTDRGYYYESPEDDSPSGKDTNLEEPVESYEIFKKRLNMTRHSTAYPHDIEEAQEYIQRNSMKHDADQLRSTFYGGKPSPAKQSNGSSNVYGDPQSKKCNNGSVNTSGEKSKIQTPPPNLKPLLGMIESYGKMGSTIGENPGLAAKKINPIATITVSRSHTRLYNYSDGYTYTEKAGRQTVVIEAPKGMYYAS